MTLTLVQQKTVSKAINIISENLRTYDVVLTNPTIVEDYLRLRLHSLQREHFKVLFFNTRLCMIAEEDMFVGTINGCAVWVREIAKRALELDATSVILAHNHPSGATTPSQADDNITKRISDALGMLDIKVIDHIIVGSSTYSYAKHNRL